ncbi:MULTISPECIES: triacylglycerol lipase [unclassified Rathayibacter]|uniref:esterase/lipase family protein n=1 Tax=unclassified Rathayibacter TaxID=2609250 RepID=UPI001FB44B77|nr:MULTISPECIES: alpha/beta hydrolase [unclassified Rathayibacter]MCJ1673457.1 alpha/beta hydrolase [Rathayibacter sp. VKM Ac-2929]MCJ1681578.1 alpha/beta hydrolase [Rathayibacter sp. VKM Ac-2928]
MTHLVRDAVWWIRDYAYAVAWQVRAFVSRRAPDDYLDGTERPIVVLPGIWETWAFLRPIIDPLHHRGHPMHVLTSLGWNGRPVARTAEDVAAYLAEHDLRDVVIVAHSKGGLIGKYVMTELDPDGRVDRMVAVATPFGGSRYAPYLLLKSLRSFSPRDATTLLLSSRAGANARITSVFGLFDPHIPEGSMLEGAVNVRIETGGHFRILSDPETLAAVVAAVDAPTRPAE